MQGLRSVAHAGHVVQYCYPVMVFAIRQVYGWASPVIAGAVAFFLLGIENIGAGWHIATAICERPLLAASCNKTDSMPQDMRNVSSVSAQAALATMILALWILMLWGGPVTKCFLYTCTAVLAAR